MSLANILGEPGKGFHEKRVVIGGLSLALWDIVGTLVVGILIALYNGSGLYGTIGTVAGLFVLGAVAHEVFGVNTALNVKLRWAVGRQL